MTCWACIGLDGCQERRRQGVAWAHRAGRAPRARPCQPRLCPQIYQSLLLRGLSLVGWYHSHPHSPALPSLQDIDAQMDYQLRLQGSSNGFQPCLALLCCEARAGGGCARAAPLGPRAPRAQPPLSLSPPSPVLLGQPGPGVQDLALLGDAAP